MQKKMPWRILIALALIILCAIIALLLAITPKQLDSLVRLTAGILAASILWLMIEVRVFVKNNRRYLSETKKLLSDSSHSLPQNLPLPIAILNDKHEFIWYNTCFEELFVREDDLFGLPMPDVMPQLSKQLSRQDHGDVTLASRTYRVNETKLNHSGNTSFVLSFHDTSRYTELRSRYQNSRLCVLLLVIDNYEDTIGSLKQSERAAVLAQFEQILDTMVERTKSLLYRLSDDHFLLLTEAQYYVDMERERFHILDEVRKISVGERNLLTISIGVGRGGESLTENRSFAEQSLDMAQGRGGDQAAVKTKSGYNFYGGVNQSVERKSKTRFRATARTFSERLETIDNVYIMGHRQSDLDAVGAAIGMAYVAEHLGKKPKIILNTKATLARPLVERLIKERADLLLAPEDAAARIQPNDLLIIVDTYSKDLV